MRDWGFEGREEKGGLLLLGFIEEKNPAEMLCDEVKSLSDENFFVVDGRRRTVVVIV